MRAEPKKQTNLLCSFLRVQDALRYDLSAFNPIIWHTVSTGCVKDLKQKIFLQNPFQGNFVKSIF